MGPDDTIRSPHATLPWQKAAHKAGSTAKPRCASSNPTDAKITLSPPLVYGYSEQEPSVQDSMEPSRRGLRGEPSGD